MSSGPRLLIWRAGAGGRVLKAELLDADRKLWHSIAGLVEDQKFTLDEALHEFTNVRGDVHSLLQPRPTRRLRHRMHRGGPGRPAKAWAKAGAGRLGAPTGRSALSRRIPAQHSSHRLCKICSLRMVRRHYASGTIKRSAQTQVANSSTAVQSACPMGKHAGASTLHTSTASSRQSRVGRRKVRPARPALETAEAMSAGTRFRQQPSRNKLAALYSSRARQLQTDRSRSPPKGTVPAQHEASPTEEKRFSRTASPRFFMACIDDDNHAISQAIVDKQLHCFSPPATRSNLAILQNDAEAHKLLQLAYSGLIGFLWGGDLRSIEDETIHWRVLSIVKAVVETAGHFLLLMPAQLPEAWHAFLQESNAHCWQLPGPQGIRHAVSSMQELAQLQGTAPRPTSIVLLAQLVVSPHASTSVPWQDFLQHCSAPFMRKRPIVCDGAGMHSSADRSLPATNLPLQHLAQQWLQYLASEDAFLHLVEHIHEGRDAHPFSHKQQAQLTAT